ncbi:hypothetical protein J6590_034147 [Homalodisca vitripennis]|nr:hypothetical protein J6590_034147 [Homalodisca vitripennis]
MQNANSLRHTGRTPSFLILCWDLPARFSHVVTKFPANTNRLANLKASDVAPAGNQEQSFERNLLFERYRGLTFAHYKLTTNGPRFDRAPNADLYASKASASHLLTERFVRPD